MGDFTTSSATNNGLASNYMHLNHSLDVVIILARSSNSEDPISDLETLSLAISLKCRIPFACGHAKMTRLQMTRSDS